MFNNQSSGYTLADIAAVSGRNDDMFGGNNAWWILLFLIWGCNGNWGGWGNQGSNLGSQYAAISDFANIERKIDGVNNGLCDGFYAQNTNMLTGFSGVNNNITQQTITGMQTANSLGNQITALGTQMQQCCCDNERLVEGKFSELNYNLATLACQNRQAVADASREIIANQEEGIRSVLQFLTNDKIATLQAENQSLKSAASQAEQNAYLLRALSPNPIPAYTVPNPYAAYVAPTCGAASIY